jgi:hypothetical protein
MHGSLFTLLLALSQPAADDFTQAGLAAAAEGVLARQGVGYRDLALDEKAEFFEWQTWRYHRTPYYQVCNQTELPVVTGSPPRWMPAADTSTWNGALLAALSYKYAATREPATLARIGELIRGLHLFFAITGQPGLMARAMTTDHALAFPEMQLGAAPDGTAFYFWADPAKGTYNQIAGGYAALMVHAYADLPPDIQQMARADLTAMVLHIIDHDYRATGAEGRPTTYGDLTPLIGSMGVPFNAQVAYQIVALAHCFPPDDPAQRARIDEQFRRLRDEHHVYYEHPLRNLLQPQRVGGSPFVKGMNDRHHVMTAAFNGLMLELDQAWRQKRPLDAEFVYQLGQTCCFTMERIGGDRNALCNFMWAALLNDPAVREAMIRQRPEAARALAERCLRDGVEQLRRFKLDRFNYPGEKLQARGPLWVDERMLDGYQWKADPTLGWKATGPALNYTTCAIDYLYAYWLFRYARLDQHPAVADHAAVLAPTVGLRLSRPAEEAFSSIGPGQPLDQAP